MTPLWILFALLTVLALLFVAVPGWRFRGGDPGADIEARKQANAALFRQRVEELRKDRDEGLVSDEQHEMLRLELERSFLHDMEQFERERHSAAAPAPL